MPYYRSSSVSWAESDLDEYMSQSLKNAPLFIEAFFDGCEGIQSGKEGFYAPDADLINDICLEYRIGYVVQPPDLVPRGEVLPLVLVPERPPTLAEEAKDLYQQSLQRAEQLLSEGRSREAVQETLWLLESVTTEFRGLETDGDVVIKGKYFNDIVLELGKIFHGTTLDRVLDWTKRLHGYLSSPTGGGIRHGLDLREGIAIGPNEARLFCNLIRSYLSYLMAEHERLTAE